MKHEINKRLVIVAFSFFTLPNSFYSQLLPTTTPKPVSQVVLFEASFNTPIVQITGKAVSTQVSQVPVKPVVKVAKKSQVSNPTEYDHWFNQYAGTYGVAVETLKSIAKCESGFNTNAINGKYVGLFQFAPSTWVTNRKAMGADPNEGLRTNPEEAIKTASFKIARDGTSAWASCVKQ